MTHHAVEILLTRPATRDEIRRACRVLPLGANSDGTRLMAVHRAKTPGRRALKTARRRLQHILPIAVLTTHYPDSSGQVIRNFEFSPATQALIGQTAAERGQRPAEYVGQSVIRALRRNEQERFRVLTAEVEGLLAHHRPEDALACTAHVLVHHHSPSLLAP